MQVDETQLLKAITKAKKDLIAFRKIILDVGEDEVAPAEAHYEWSDLLLNGKDNEAIEAFRESGKTQYVLRAFLLYALQFPDTSRDYIVLIKSNTKLAQQKLKEVQAEYESNPALRSNMVRIREQTVDVFSVDVRDGERIRNVRIEAYGKGSSIRGLVNIDRRPRIVIIDDPQDVEDSLSPTTQISDWNWFLSDVMFLGKNTRIFIIGNNLGEACIIERIEANAKELKFHFVRVPELKPDGTAAWPAKSTIEEILEERANFEKLGKIDIWLREKMCVAVADETRIFLKDDFRYFSHANLERLKGQSNHFIAIDPATALGDASDYRVVLHNMVTPDNDWFLADCSYGRYDTNKLFDELFIHKQV